MNLSDATGENIAYGVKVKGRVMPVTGIPPFIVTLGAPEVVKISYAGESLNMSFLPSGRIAKFDLPLSE
jgi:cytoskeleton protein RodZ